MTTVQEVLEAAKHLSPVEQLEVIRALSGALQSQYAQQPVRQPTRVLGLRKDQVWISSDFDAELPDEFWLGSDDEPAA
jgi:hypothetical protein